MFQPPPHTHTHTHTQSVECTAYALLVLTRMISSPRLPSLPCGANSYTQPKCDNVTVPPRAGAVCPYLTPLSEFCGVSNTTHQRTVSLSLSLSLSLSVSVSRCLALYLPVSTVSNGSNSLHVREISVGATLVYGTVLPHAQQNMLRTGIPADLITCTWKQESCLRLCNIDKILLNFALDTESKR